MLGWRKLRARWTRTIDPREEVRSLVRSASVLPRELQRAIALELREAFPDAPPLRDFRALAPQLDALLALSSVASGTVSTGITGTLSENTAAGSKKRRPSRRSSVETESEDYARAIGNSLKQPLQFLPRRDDSWNESPPGYSTSRTDKRVALRDCFRPKPAVIVEQTRAHCSRFLCFIPRTRPILEIFARLR